MLCSYCKPIRLMQRGCCKPGMISAYSVFGLEREAGGVEDLVGITILGRGLGLSLLLRFWAV